MHIYICIYEGKHAIYFFLLGLSGVPSLVSFSTPLQPFSAFMSHIFKSRFPTHIGISDLYVCRKEQKDSH